MLIRVTLRCMAESEIAKMIPAETIAEIKLTDPTPIFQAYVVGHEGEARGHLIGVGNIVKRWAQAVIEKLHEKIQMGLELFHGHGVTNEHEGRIPIGRVVGKMMKTINGKLSSIVACYIQPAYRRRNLDVASIEASVDMDIDGNGQLVVKDVGDVTGIALANSEIEKPGFAGATLLGQLQAFAREKGIEPQLGYEIPPQRGYHIQVSAVPDGRERKGVQ